MTKFRFLDIIFHDLDYQEIINILSKKKGYLSIPAASALINIMNNNIYRNSLKNSTLNIFDSGLFCLCIFFFKFKRVRKFSGYKFINEFVNDSKIKLNKILVLNPTKKIEKINKTFLRSKKFKYVKSYTCPIYDINNIIDYNLLKIINNYKPVFIIINISGGTQEPLALFLKKNSKIKFIAICSGAALGFLTKTDAPITNLIDRLYLGWLARIFFNPTQFIPRFIKSLYLIPLVIFNKITILDR